MGENLRGGVRKHDGGFLAAGGVRENVHQHGTEKSQNRPKKLNVMKFLMSCLEQLLVLLVTHPDYKESASSVQQTLMTHL